MVGGTEVSEELKAEEGRSDAALFGEACGAGDYLALFM